jgi:hypothetical protein
MYQGSGNSVPVGKYDSHRGDWKIVIYGSGGSAMKERKAARNEVHKMKF